MKALTEVRAPVILEAVQSLETTGVFRVEDSEPSDCTMGKNFFLNASQTLSSNKNECPKIHSLTQTISPG